jgi:hypothetical protein
MANYNPILKYKWTIVKREILILITALLSLALRTLRLCEEIFPRRACLSGRQGAENAKNKRKD